MNDADRSKRQLYLRAAEGDEDAERAVLAELRRKHPDEATFERLVSRAQDEYQARNYNSAGSLLTLACELRFNPNMRAWINEDWPSVGVPAWWLACCQWCSRRFYETTPVGFGTKWATFGWFTEEESTITEEDGTVSPYYPPEPWW